VVTDVPELGTRCSVVGGPPVPRGSGEKRENLAETILRFQCVERTEANRESKVHASESREARLGGATRTVALEQFSGIPLRGDRAGAGEVSRMGVRDQGAACPEF
jgi:hypothetical protein